MSVRTNTKMNMRLLAGLLCAGLAGLVVAGCVTEGALVAEGGSRADGIVRLSGDFSPRVRLRPDPPGDLARAEAICRGWDYSSARPLSPAVSGRSDGLGEVESLGGGGSGDVGSLGAGGLLQCDQRGIFTGKCLSGRVTIPYQCVGPQK